MATAGHSHSVAPEIVLDTARCDLPPLMGLLKDMLAEEE